MVRRVCCLWWRSRIQFYRTKKPSRSREGLQRVLLVRLELVDRVERDRDGIFLAGAERLVATEIAVPTHFEARQHVFPEIVLEVAGDGEQLVTIARRDDVIGAV